MNRREFIKRGCLVAAGVSASPILMDIFTKRLYASSLVPFRKEAMYYKKIDEATVQCVLCPRKCTLMNGQRGFCKAREPRNGKLYSLVWGLPCAVHVDPIEKKPLFHFLPGTSAFSIATAGCNFKCKNCQNWSISQFPPEDVRNENLLPQDVVGGAKRTNCKTIAYTYTEPSIFYEYMLETSKLAKAQGVKNMYHSNGSLNPDAVKELVPYLDGADIDLKAFNQDFYTDVCAGYLDTVLETLKILKKNNVWLEITVLIIPTLNDDMAEIKKMMTWVRSNLGADVPIHLSRFHPQYKMKTLPPTPVSTLVTAREVAQTAGLKYVYIGNVPGHDGESTYCPKCKKPAVKRRGYTILENNITNGKCKSCGCDIEGVWS